MSTESESEFTIAEPMKSDEVTLDVCLPSRSLDCGTSRSRSMAVFPRMVKLALSLVLVLVAQFACNQGAASGDVQVVNTRMLTQKKPEGITLHELMEYVLTHVQLWQVSIAIQVLGVCTGCLSYVIWKCGEAYEDKQPDMFGIAACSSQVSDMISDIGLSLVLLQLWWELAVASFVHLVAVACLNFYIVKRFVSHVKGSEPDFWAGPFKDGKAFLFRAIMVFALFGPQILKVFGTHAMGMALCDLDMEAYFDDKFTQGILFEASFQIIINTLVFIKLSHTMTQAQRTTSIMSAAYSIFNMLLALMECAFAERRAPIGSPFRPIAQTGSSRTADMEMDSHLEELEAATTVDDLKKAMRRARNSEVVSDETLQTFENKLKKLEKLQALTNVEAAFAEQGTLGKKRQTLKSAQQLGVVGLHEFEQNLMELDKEYQAAVAGNEGGGTVSGVAYTKAQCYQKA